MADTYFSSVGLLLHCNGSAGSTTFTDNAPTPKTVTAVGDAKIDTAQSKFGGASALFDGTGDYLTTPNHADLTLASGDWTIEFWVRLNSTGVTQVLANHGSGTGFFPWQFWFDTSTSKLGFRGYNSGSSLVFNLQQSGTSTTGVWYHVAGVRDANTMRFFVDGAAQGTAAISGSLFSTTATVAFGAYNNGVAPLNGWLDDIRVTKGVARYTAAFTPPTAQFDDFGFTSAWLLDGGLPAAPSALAGLRVQGLLADSGPLQLPSVLGRVHVAAQLVDGGLPSAPSGRGWHLFAVAQVASVLGINGEAVEAFHDFRPLVHDYPVTYAMDLVTPGGAIRVPISSWQATLQTRDDCFASCVIPHCEAWMDDVYAASEFVVWRRGTTLAGEPFEHQMVRAPLTQYQVDQGTTNHTCSLSGYFDAFTTYAAPHERYDSTLSGLRSISSYPTGLRLRTAIDWLVQPGRRAYYGEAASMVVSYINYYVNGSDEYIDVGRREDA